jgi:type IV pilus assembly protein PilN
MIRINLIPVEEVQRAAGQRQEVVLGAFVLAVFGLGLVAAHVWQTARTASARRAIVRLDEELSAIAGPYADVSHLQQQKRELREKLRVIGELEAKKTGPLRVLVDLSSSTPDKLWLTEFNETAGAMKVSGLGVDEQTVADFMRRLATSSYFTDVDLDETTLVDKDGVKHRRFVVRGNVNYIGSEQARAHAKADPPAGGATK